MTKLDHGLCYKGKTLSNEENSITYGLNGVKDSRATINAQAHPGIRKEAMGRELTDKDGDGVPRFLIHDYGSGDTLTVPSIIPADVAEKRHEP